MTEERPTSSRWALWCGAVLFWAVQLTLLFVVGLPLVDTILVAVLAVGVPALALWQVPLVDDVEIERTPAYWGSIVTIWLLGSAAWLVGTRADGAAALGISAIAQGPLLAWTVGLTVIAMVIILLFRQIAIRSGTPDGPLLRKLMPRTSGERGVFAVLSLTAGVGEELAYRGYFIGVTAPALGTGPAVVFSSAAFGVVHAYQGRLGVVRTALIGAVFAWGFLTSGSLVPVMIAHSLVDLIGGIVLGERLLSPQRPGGVDGEPTPRDPEEAPPWK